MIGPAEEAAYRYAADLVGRFEPDRHIAAMFAPPDRRPHLAAIHAFALEIGRIRASVSDAMPGEIRLQWWREALAGERASEAAANPVSAALLSTVAANRLPLKPFLDMIEARAFDLYDDLMPDWTALEGHLGETQSALVQVGSMVLLKGEDPQAPDAAGHAGVAIGLAALLRAFPWHARRGQVLLPAALLDAVGVSRSRIVAGEDSDGLRAALSDVRARARDHLAKARAAMVAVRPEARPAFLPLAMVEPYLCMMEQRGYNPFADVIDVADWRRIWRMWRWRR